MSDSSSTFSSDLRRFSVRALFLLAGVVCACAALHRFETDSDVDVVGDKLGYFRARADEYSVVFVGSSYVYREISPAVFDAATGARGVATRSFNFGIPGMDPPETYFLIDRILEAKRGRLEWVVLELDYFRAQVRARNVHTRRFDYWHDAGRTADAARAAVDSDAPPGQKGKDVAAHVEAFARRFFDLGRGRAILEPLFGQSGAAEPPESLGSNRDGFRSLDEEEASRYELRRGFYEALEQDRYEEKLATLKAGGNAEQAAEPVGEIDVEALRETLDRIRARGARPVLLIPPCLATRADLVRLRDAGVFADLLAFNSPDAYPQLYDPAYRFDVGHLNAAGAALFTELLAERFVDLVRGE